MAEEHKKEFHRNFRRERFPREERKEPAKREKKVFPGIKLFGKWDDAFEISDMSLRNYLNIDPKFLPKSAGRLRKPFHKSKAHIVERLAQHMLVCGHRGKKHRITSGKFAGNLYNTLTAVEKAFDIIEKKEKKNPIEVFVRALENAALREEIISYQLGSIVARESVITAPQRRIDKALRYFAQGAFRKSFKNKKKLEQALADEILGAYKNSNESFAIGEKERIEREAIGAR